MTDTTRTTARSYPVPARALAAGDLIDLHGRPVQLVTAPRQHATFDGLLVLDVRAGGDTAEPVTIEPGALVRAWRCPRTVTVACAACGTDIVVTDWDIVQHGHPSGAAICANCSGPAGPSGPVSVILSAA